jgi:hypothetical protein
MPLGNIAAFVFGPDDIASLVVAKNGISPDFTVVRV